MSVENEDGAAGASNISKISQAEAANVPRQNPMSSGAQRSVGCLVCLPMSLFSLERCCSGKLAWSPCRQCRETPEEFGRIESPDGTFRPLSSEFGEIDHLLRPSMLVFAKRNPYGEYAYQNYMLATL